VGLGKIRCLQRKLFTALTLKVERFCLSLASAFAAFVNRVTDALLFKQVLLAGPEYEASLLSC
jgi:hypothetical protein